MGRNLMAKYWDVGISEGARNETSGSWAEERYNTSTAIARTIDKTTNKTRYGHLSEKGFQLGCG
jgi:hypothetical protein